MEIKDQVFKLMLTMLINCIYTAKSSTVLCNNCITMVAMCARLTVFSHGKRNAVQAFSSKWITAISLFKVQVLTAVTWNTKSFLV